MSKNNRWVKRWEIPGSNGKVWTVAQDKDQNWGCSCPKWKFQKAVDGEREDCHHIELVKMNGGEPVLVKDRPEYILANIRKPKYDEKENKLYCPLIAIPDIIMMEATICYYLLKYGYSWDEVKEMRHGVPKSWTVKAILWHVETYGEAEHPEGWGEYRRGK